MSRLDGGLTSDELSSHVVPPLVSAMLDCLQRLTDTRRRSSSNDDVDRLTSCETSITVECRRLMRSTGVIGGDAAGILGGDERANP